MMRKMFSFLRDPFFWVTTLFISLTCDIVRLVLGIERWTLAYLGLSLGVSMLAFGPLRLDVRLRRWWDKARP